MKKRAIQVLSFWMLMTCLLASCQSHAQNITEFKIVITNFYFGRISDITILTNDSLQFERDVLHAKHIVASRKISRIEKEELLMFLNNFPLSKLNTKYLNNEVEDGTQIKFNIKIDNIEKGIYVSNAYQKDLGNLVAIIVKMLPEDYIGYNQESVPWKAN